MTNPMLSDAEMAELIWREIFDIEPVPPFEKDEAFQHQIKLVKLMRANHGRSKNPTSK